MDGFTFFSSYYESAQHLNDDDQALFYKIIMDYMFIGKEPKLDGHLMGFWLLVKPNLDTSKSRAKAGQKKSKQNQTEIKTESNTKPSPLEDKDKDKEYIKEIVNNLNLILGSKYKASTESTSSSIRARLSEGYTVDDFKKVHKVKFEEWNNTDMSKHLNPGTLYRPGNFEKYVNQDIKVQEQIGGVTW